MAVNRNTKIVEDGIEFSLDADNVKSSYIGDTRALDLDGSTARLIINDTQVQMQNTTSGSFAAWCKIPDNTPAASRVIFGFGDTVANEFIWLDIITDGTIRFRFVTAAGGQIMRLDSATQVPQDTWFHVAAVQNGTNPEIYLNGQNDSDTFVDDTDKTFWFSGSSIDNGRIGSVATNNLESTLQFYVGQIDTAMVYNRDLSAIEVSDLYNSGSGLNYTQLTTAQKDGLVSHFDMNETGTDTRIDSHGGYNAIPSGSTTHTTGHVNAASSYSNALDMVGVTALIPQNGCNFVTGSIPQVWNFDGTDDYINADSLLDTISSDTTGTIEAWVKPTTASNTENIFSIADVNTNEYVNIINIAGKLRTVTQVAGTTQWLLISDSVVFTDATWTHVAVSQNGTSPVIYFNGVAISQSFTVTTDKTKWTVDTTNVDNVKVGALEYNGAGVISHFTGKISQVRYYNRALTAQEIEQNYNTTKHRYI